MPRKGEMNWAKRVEEIGFEEGRQASAKRWERVDKLDTAKDRQIRENRKKSGPCSGGEAPRSRGAICGLYGFVSKSFRRTPSDRYLR